MTQEDKELLLKDLSARLSYNVRVHVKFYGDYSDEISEHDFVLNEIDTRYPSNCYWIGGEQLRDCDEFNTGTTDFAIDIDDEDQEIKPYLRLMSSMTEEEKLMYEGLMIGTDNISYMLDVIDWLNAHHFDYRGLIEKGLAIAVTEDNNPYKL